MPTDNKTEEPAVLVENDSSYVDLDDMPDMDELLSGDKAADYAEGVLVTGKVVDKRDGGVMVDFGFKSEAFVRRDEFANWTELGEGDEITAILEELEDEDNMPLLSVERARQEEAWRQFTGKCKEGDKVDGTVRKRVKGGLIVDVGVEAFLPGSQVDTAPVRNMDDLIGTTHVFKILKITSDRRNVVISRRELLEEQKGKQRAKLMGEILPGQLRSGKVKNITDFGAFIDLVGIDGLIHITDLSWGRISHPSEVLNIGEEVETVILDVDHVKQRVSLGLKQKSPDPWELVDERYPVESRITGRVVNVMPYGAFVEIEPGVEGLIHVSEMSWTKRVTRASDILAPGQEVEAVVLDIQRDAKKISLGLRQTMENPWEQAAAKYPPGTQIEGRVRNMTSYGAFIEIEEEIDGMVHVSDMSWTRKINNPAEVLKKGDTVQAMVLDVDPKQRRVSLGIKQLADDPWSRIHELFQADMKVKGTVSKLTSFGAFVQLDHDIDGLVHISQLSDERVNKVRDVLKVGDEVEARVIKIDAGERRIGLSMRPPQAQEPGPARKRRPEPAGRDGGGDGLKPGANMVDVGDLIATAMEEAKESQAEEEQADE